MTAKQYLTTFTPNTEPEIAKVCVGCNKLLAPSKFRGNKGKRDNVEGIIRHTKCRECETNSKSVKTLDQKIQSIQDSIDELKETVLALGEKYIEIQKSLSKKQG